MNPQRRSLYSMTLQEIKDFLIAHEHSEHLATSVYESLYKKNVSNQFSEKTLHLLEEHFERSLPVIVSTKIAEDGTVKFLMQFEDGKKVETVLIPFFKKFTVCLSSQVGCAMKCSFCYTGTQGLTRHLKSSEIIGQYLKAKQYLEENISKDSLTPNIVFMGQGEPLHNFEEVQKALEIMLNPLGPALGPRQITLSTAGFLPGLKKFSLMPKVNLALSLHSPFNDVRKKLIPITGQYPIEDIFSALDEVETNLMKRQLVTYEYLLIDGINDRDEDVAELHRLLGHRKAIINIIPFNPFPGSEFNRPTTDQVELFKEKLVEKKLRTLVRTTKGSDILAACGQLVS